jgi:hypothetical protein
VQPWVLSSRMCLCVVWWKFSNSWRNGLHPSSELKGKTSGQG